MDINRCTEKAQEALRSAQGLALRGGQQQVDVEHLFLALLEQEPGLATSILRKANINLEGLKRRLEQDVARLPKVSVAQGDDNISITGRLNRLFARAEDEAKRLKDQYVSVEHFLLALIEDTGTSGRLLKEFGVTRDRLQSALQEVRGNQRVTTQNPEATYEALE